jgi:hypothetical protein
VKPWGRVSFFWQKIESIYNIFLTDLNFRGFTMLQDINLWAVFVAALSVFALGGIWYTPMLFGKIWLTEESREKAQKRHSPLVFIISFLLSLAAALVFAIFLGPNPNLTYALGAGFTVGVSWLATSFGINYLFAGRSLKLFLIDAGYHVVQFSLYGLILGLWH